MVTHGFHQTDPSPYLGGRLPVSAADRLVPRPARYEIKGSDEPIALALHSGRLRVRIPPETGLALERFLESALQRRGIDLDLETREDDSETRVDVAFSIDRESEFATGEHGESYVLLANAAADPPVQVLARESLGLLRGAATLVQLLEPAAEGVRAPRAEIRDRPALDLRILGGWALARSDRLQEAIDLAVTVKANRVLYNAWGFTPRDRLWEEDAYLARYARERGIELIFELRRMSFGRDWRISDSEKQKVILDVFAGAIDHGFRAFGFLFDDVSWESAEEECAFLLALHERLSAQLGHPAELFACPQYYWPAGQMAGDWSGAAGPEETERQRRYLEVWGRTLPADIHLYVANWWADIPPGWESELEDGFESLVGRRPVFFDNQLINDYRLGAIVPSPLRDRPQQFARRFAGYLLNAPRPLDIHAPAVASALAYAWNPADYDPEAAFGSAMLDDYGPAAPAAIEVTRALARLATEWADGDLTATNHYRTIGRLVLRGRVERTRVERWLAELESLEKRWLSEVVLGIPLRAPIRVTRGASTFQAGLRRLRSDLDIFLAFLSCRSGAIDRLAFERRFDRARHVALQAVADLLPPLANLVDFIESADGSADESPPPRGSSPAWSWVEYFWANTRRELERLRVELASELRESASGRRG